MKSLYKKLGSVALGGFAALTFAAISPVMASPATHPLVKAFPESTVFQKDVKKYDRVELVAGPVDYLKGDNEGYLASLKLEALGESRVWINDHSMSDSAVHLYQEMLDRLAKDHFEVVYRCEQIQCGDLTAWQLYLSEQLEGDESSQHYVLARQAGSKGSQWLVQFYVIDLDGEPRSYLRILDASTRPQLKLAFNHRLLTLDKQYPTVALLDNIPDILFESGMAELNENANDYLLRLKHELIESGATRLTIAGHTDSVGTEEDNERLSESRARAVEQVLTRDNALAGLTINVEHYGEEQPVADNRQTEGRKQNRRVTIEYQQPLKTSAIN
ncbi:OmpA family protein [Endozoicomonas acroporae]|uniref:OmpA family protein n=1 Tax=Endozoicomonas acroporae TaxID=1701104 RepID=UPI000C787FF2|nr:OmpA family protein [Endozoicomonas acroporae]